MTEADLQRGVLDIARLTGWRSVHFRSARTAHGWRTPVSGDGLGFPDVLLVRGPRCVVAELKAEKGRVTPDQQAWLDALAESGAEAYVWRPVDYPDAILRILR